jgi:ABC-type Fe3+-hydroxamate transport system substrate-binding protein
LAPKNLSDIYGDISLLAALTGALERGAAVVQAMRDEIAGTAAKTRDGRRPRVFC